MGKGRRKYEPKAFESTTGATLSASLFASMLQSENWQKLTPGAQITYVYMKLQYYGAKPINEHPREHFYFNDALARQTYKISSNKQSCQNWRNELIRYGFIELVEYRAHSFDKNIYTYSDKWKTGQEYPIPEVLKKKRGTKV